MKYRIGVSPSIPATGPDNTIPVKYLTSFPGEAADYSSDGDTDPGDLYVAFAQSNSPGGKYDGIYLKDVAGNGPLEKAPGSSFTSIGAIGTFGRLAIASTLGRAGIFLAYCSSVSPCEVLLWRVGTPKPLVVPDSGSAFNPAVAAGPHGRLWVAWVDTRNQDIMVVRTNEADTKFGPVEAYPSPCSFGESMSLGGGNWRRLEAALTCSNTMGKEAVYATQLIVPLSFSPRDPTIVNKTATSVTFKVTDVGDPVAGAKVSVDGKSATTNSAGTAKISFPKGAKTGKYRIIVSAGDYNSARGELVIKT
jgi:hypothetical protein